MKKILLLAAGFGLMTACSVDESSLEDWENWADENTQMDDIEENVEDFANGEVYSGRGFFNGLLSENLDCDVKFHEVEALADEGATVEELHAAIDVCLDVCNNAMAAYKMNKKADWPLAQEYLDLSKDWTETVMWICEDYLYDMAEVWNTDWDAMTDEQLDLWDEYDLAMEEFWEVDWEWVDYQEVYAAANGFELSEDGIDVDDLVGEDMEENNIHHQE